MMKEKFMIKDSKRIASLINDVVKLVEANNKVNQSIKPSDPDFFEKSYKQTPEKIALITYFESLSNDDVELIQAIMYIGRDSKVYYVDENIEITEQELLDTVIQHFKGLHSDNSIAISHIIEKEPLDIYLKDGARDLNILLNEE